MADHSPCMLRASLYAADQRFFVGRPLLAALCIMLSLLLFAGQPQLDQEESFVPLGLVRWLHGEHSTQWRLKQSKMLAPEVP